MAGGGADTKEDSVQLREPVGEKAEGRGRAACLRFEGCLLGEMLKTMRDVEGESKGILPVSRGEKMFVRQQCEALGDVLAEQEPLGIARLLGRTIHSTGFNGGGHDEDRDLQLQPDGTGGGDAGNGRAG